MATSKVGDVVVVKVTGKARSGLHLYVETVSTQEKGRIYAGHLNGERRQRDQRVLAARLGDLFEVMVIEITEKGLELSERAVGESRQREN